MASHETVAVLGAGGTMGYAMALNLARAGYLRMKGKAIMQRDFEPSFRLKLAAKDASLVQEAAERHGLDLPLVRAVRARLDQAVPEHGDEDMSATYLTSAPS